MALSKNAAASQLASLHRNKQPLSIPAPAALASHWSSKLLTAKQALLCPAADSSCRPDRLQVAEDKQTAGVDRTCSPLRPMGTGQVTCAPSSEIATDSQGLALVVPLNVRLSAAVAGKIDVYRALMHVCKALFCPLLCADNWNIDCTVTTIVTETLSGPHSPALGSTALHTA